jgi:hypothetical protein
MMLNKPGVSYGDASRNTPNASAMGNFRVDVRICTLYFRAVEPIGALARCNVFAAANAGAHVLMK